MHCRTGPAPSGCTPKPGARGELWPGMHATTLFSAEHARSPQASLLGARIFGDPSILSISPIFSSGYRILSPVEGNNWKVCGLRENGENGIGEHGYLVTFFSRFSPITPPWFFAIFCDLYRTFIQRSFLSRSYDDSPSPPFSPGFPNVPPSFPIFPCFPFLHGVFGYLGTSDSGTKEPCTGYAGWTGMATEYDDGWTRQAAREVQERTEPDAAWHKLRRAVRVRAV